MHITLTTEQAQELLQITDAAVRVMDMLDAAAAAETANPAPEDQ